jgi:DNA-binding protein H-NS
MSIRLDKKLNKLSEKMEQLRQEMQALEAQKNAKLTIESEEIKAIVKTIQALAHNNDENLASVATLVHKACRGETGSKKPNSLAPKYRDPMEYNNTWTGRGIEPLWLQRYTSNGRKREEFLIKN